MLNNGFLVRESLFDRDISVIVGKKKCIGSWSDGVWNPCDNYILSSLQCPDCKQRDDWALCIECRGEQCKNEKARDSCKQQPFWIYLASFDSLVKVGISQTYRFHERLIEQGADFGARIGSVTDGLLVRKYEQELAEYLDLPDRVRGEEKQSLLFGDPNRSAASLLKTIIKLKKSGFSFLVNPQIFDFRHHFRINRIKKEPERLKIVEGQEINGKIVAAKGPIIILEKENEYFSINIHRLLGRELIPAKENLISI